MAKLFANIFKSRSQRQSELRKKEADEARAFDYGAQSAETIISIIDEWRKERLIPFVKNQISDFKEEMKHCHKHENLDRAFLLMNQFKASIEKWKIQAENDIWGHLGEWKYMSIEFGTKASFDAYIEQQFGNVWQVANEQAKSEILYCAARQGGHISDEMHKMTPGELERFARESKLGQFKE